MVSGAALVTETTLFFIGLICVAGIVISYALEAAQAIQGVLP